MEHLPNDLIMEITLYMSMKSVVELSLSCKKLYNIINSNMYFNARLGKKKDFSPFRLCALRTNIQRLKYTVEYMKKNVSILQNEQSEAYNNIYQLWKDLDDAQCDAHDSERKYKRSSTHY